MKHTFSTFIIAMLFFANSAKATLVPVDQYVTAGNGVVISFDFPVQPADHNGIFIFAGVSMRVGTIVRSRLFDEAGLLGEKTGDVFPLFTDPTNFHSGDPYAVDIDFSRLADGAKGARLEITVLNSVPGAYIQFNTGDLFGQGFGNSGTYSGYDAVFTSVQPFVSSVPEPGTLPLTLLGLIVIFAFTRRHKFNRRASKQ